MAELLASDDNNPNFVGATNPDSRLAVIFYKKLIRNEFKSQQEGRPIHEEHDFVKIFVPGDSTTIIDTFAREDHKKRFPIHWARYRNSQDANSQIVGTPLSQWPQLTQSVAEDLRHFKFMTVESIANASDAQINSIGMAAGMNPYTLRDKAKAFLMVTHNSAEVAQREEELTAIKEQNKQLADMVNQLKDQVLSLVEKKPRGRPKIDNTEESNIA